MFSSTTDDAPNFGAAQSPAHSLFAQLRNRYPQGALTAELVQFQDGQFVVKAIVHVGNAIVATGMAAADKVELAEDRARIRAMEVLGIAPTIGTLTFDTSVRSVPEPVKEAEVPPLKSFEPTIAEVPLPPVEELVPAMVEAPAKKTRKKKEEPSVPAPDLLSFSSLELPEPEPEPTPEPTPEPPVFDMDFSSPEPEMVYEPEPIDLSDAIAQIGAEIERIGWTKKQGSTYLQQTYGKKTRAELTEDELLEFLHYLKALPSQGLGQLPF